MDKKDLRVFEYTKKILVKLEKFIKVGMTEYDIADFILEQNAKVSFFPIVAFEDHTSEAHHMGNNKVLKYDDIILVDFGYKIGTQCSDITRMYTINKSGLVEFRHNGIVETIRMLEKMVLFTKDKTELKLFTENHMRMRLEYGVFHGIKQIVHDEDTEIFAIEIHMELHGYGFRLENNYTIENGKLINLTGKV